MKPYDCDLIGQAPEVSGRVLEELASQDYRSQEQLFSPHQVFLLIEGQWWRTFSDGPMLYWQQQSGPPEAWDIAEESMFFTVRDLGRELKLRGEVLSGWSYGVRNHTPSLALNFQDGRQITFFGVGMSWTGFELVRWTFSPGSS